MSVVPTTWAEALDLLERDVDAVEVSLAAGASGMELADVSLPTNLGPVPAHLLDRARAIRGRQDRVELELALAVQRARQAMAFGDLVPAAGPSLIDRRH